MIKAIGYKEQYGMGISTLIYTTLEKKAVKFQISAQAGALFWA